MQVPSVMFSDGAAYERLMGRWSQKVATGFLDWLAVPPGLDWLDVGCGNGAFTEMIVRLCAPASIEGIDPSEEQLAHARAQTVLRDVEFRQGDAMALPFGDDEFDLVVHVLGQRRIRHRVAVGHDRVGRLGEIERRQALVIAHFADVLDIVAADAPDAANREQLLRSGDRNGSLRRRRVIRALRRNRVPPGRRRRGWTAARCTCR